MFLREILDALELDAVDIAGNSMGGLWSVAFALEAPERVSRLALVGAPPGVTRRVPMMLWVFGLPLLARPVARRLLSNPTRDSSREFWGKLLVAHPERLDDVLLDMDVAHMRRNAESVISVMTRVAGPLGRRLPKLGERWTTLGVPTLALFGERDAFMTAKTWAAWDGHRRAQPRRSASCACPTQGTCRGSTSPSASWTSSSTSSQHLRRKGGRHDHSRAGADA